jgi:hypothetical protein
MSTEPFDNYSYLLKLKEEAIDALVIDLHFGKDRAIKLVDEWGKGIYVPYSVWSKIKC